MLSHTGTLNVEEVDVVSSGVHHGPECHGVGNLPVEPNVLVGGEEPGNAGADNTDNVAQHGNDKGGAGAASPQLVSLRPQSSRYTVPSCPSSPRDPRAVGSRSAL